MTLISCLFAISLLLAFLTDRLPFFKSVKAISIITRNSVKTIRSATVGDTEKQRRLLKNSWEIFRRTTHILGLAIIVFAAGYLLIVISDILQVSSSTTLFSYLGTRQGILVSLGSFLTYFSLKKVYAWVRV